jgi:hypothetical protein
MIEASRTLFTICNPQFYPRLNMNTQYPSDLNSANADSTRIKTDRVDVITGLLNNRDRVDVITGLFNDRDSAERAYNAVTERGYDKGDVNLVMSDATRKKHFASGDETELGNRATEGAGIGSAIGGTLGAIAAAIATVGTTLAIPGLGLIIAGPAAAALAGLGAGGLTGGVVGALIGLGIPEERVKHYQNGIDQGGILMGVKTRSAEDAAHFEKEWKANNGQHVYR